MAAHRKLDQRRVCRCPVELRKHDDSRHCDDLPVIARIDIVNITPWSRRLQTDVGLPTLYAATCGQGGVSCSDRRARDRVLTATEPLSAQSQSANGFAQQHS
jgi:hypothetical protein